MIFFVGDKPSAKNKNPEVPFVGTQSYKRLLDWIWQLDVSITDVILCNTKNIDKLGQVDTPGMSTSIEADDYVIALGKVAEKSLRDKRIPFFPMPHPSPKNFKLNNKKFVKQKLKECKLWLKK